MRNQSPRKQIPKECHFCVNQIKKFDYKDVILLNRFTNTVGKIIPRKKTGTCSKHQQPLSRAVKRARVIGLLPFVAR